MIDKLLDIITICLGFICVLGFLFILVSGVLVLTGVV